MTPRPCANCGRAMTDQAIICHDCTTTLRTRLTELPWLASELETTLIRDTQIGDRQPGRSAVTALPWNEQAAVVLRQLTGVVAAWCHLAEADAGARPHDGSVPGHVTAILDVLPDLRAHDAAGDLAGEIHDLHRYALHVIDHPDDRARVPVGPCPEEYPDGPGQRASCPGAVIAHYPIDGRPYLACTSCQAQWPPEQWPRVGRLMQARQAVLGNWPTAADVARHLGLSITTVRNTATVQRWRRHSNGRITHYHPDDITNWLDHRAQAG